MTTAKTSISTVPLLKTATPVPPASPAAQVAPAVFVKKAAKRTSPGKKSVVKTAATTPAKMPTKAGAKTVVRASLKPKAAKPTKEKKAKLMRDSFTIPKHEYEVLGELKHRAGKLSMQIKKSELLRAGIKALTAMSDSAFLAVLKAVPTIKTGRPAKD